MRTPSLLDFELDPKFFGLNSAYQVALHEELFEIVWESGGRLDWNTLYNLPLHIKRLWIKKINQKRIPHETAESHQKQAEIKSMNKLYNPEINF